MAGERILVVDDEPTVREVVQHYLEREGYRVQAAEDGPAALAAFGADAPDLIVLADTVCCAETAEGVAQRPAFDTVPAVQEGRVLEGNDDIASRWGPRIADFAESVAETLNG